MQHRRVQKPLTQGVVNELLKGVMAGSSGQQTVLSE